MQRLEYAGPGIYRGSEIGTHATIVAKIGDVVQVSEEKADQLLRDYPKYWKRAGQETNAVVQSAREERITEPDHPEIESPNEPSKLVPAKPIPSKPVSEKSKPAKPKKRKK